MLSVDVVQRGVQERQCQKMCVFDKMIKMISRANHADFITKKRTLFSLPGNIFACSPRARIHLDLMESLSDCVACNSLFLSKMSFKPSPFSAYVDMESGDIRITG